MIPKFRAYDSGSLSHMYQPDEVMVCDGKIWIQDEDSEDYDKDKGRWYGDGLSRTYRIDIAKRFLPYYYKVIGNIYENQELLEVDNEN